MIKRRSSQGLHLNIFLDFKIQSSVSQTRTSRLSGSGSLSLSVAPVAPRGLHGRPWRLCRASAFGKQSSLWRDFQTTERPVPASPLCRVSGPFLPTLSTGAGAAPEARGRSLSVPGWSLPRSPARVHVGNTRGKRRGPGTPGSLQGGAGFSDSGHESVSWLEGAGGRLGAGSHTPSCPVLPGGAWPRHHLLDPEVHLRFGHGNRQDPPQSWVPGTGAYSLSTVSVRVTAGAGRRRAPRPWQL